MTGFLKKDEVRSTSFDQKCSSHLFETLKRSKKLHRSSKPKQWPSEFTKLREVDQVSKKRIKEALIWYRKHIGQKFVQVCLSASSFRKKFHNIELSMSHHDDFVPDPTKVKITDEIIELQEERLPGFKWLGDEEKDELLFLQLSYDNYCDFIEKLKLLWFWAEKNDPTEIQLDSGKTRIRPGRMDWVAETFYESVANPKELVVGWAFEVHKIAISWDKWNHDLLNWVWRTSHWKVRKDMIDQVFWSFNMSDKADAEARWDSILEGIKNHVS